MFSKTDVTGNLHIVLSDGVYIDTLNIMPIGPMSRFSTS